MAAPSGVGNGGYVVNDVDGDPDIIGVAKTLNVTISGPTVIRQGSYPIWTANPTGGPSPYQYYWEERYQPNSGAWSGWSYFGNQQSEGMTYDPSIYEIELKVTVTDANNNTATANLYAYMNSTNSPLKLMTDSTMSSSQ